MHIIILSFTQLRLQLTLTRLIVCPLLIFVILCAEHNYASTVSTLNIPAI